MKQDKNIESHLTQKLRLQDRVPLGSVYGKNVAWFIKNEPIELWYKVHPDKDSLTKQENRYRISLVRTAYCVLKTEVAKINPALVKDVEKTFDLIKTKKKLQKEIKYGILGSASSRFKKVDTTSYK